MRGGGDNATFEARSSPAPAHLIGGSSYSSPIYLRSLATNFAVLTAGELFGKLLTLAAFTYLGRLLGPERYGSLEFVLAVMVFLAQAVDFGLGDYAAREIVRDRARVPAFLTQIPALRFWLALGCFGVLLLFVPWIPKSIEVKFLLLLYGLSLFASPALLQWLFQGHDYMHWVAAASITRAAVFVGLIFLFLHADTPLPYIGVLECVSMIAAAAVSLYIVRGRLGFTLRALEIRPRALVPHLREAMPIGLSELAWACLWYSSIVVLGLLVADRTLGWFGAAHRAVLAVHTFVWLYFFNLLPSISRSVLKPREQMMHLIGNSLAVVAWGGMLVALLMTLFSRQLLTLAYGPGFAEAAPLLSVLAWTLPVAMLGGHYRYTLIACGRTRWLLYSMGIAAAGSLSLSFVLIPRFGAMGAASALLVATVIDFALVYFSVQRNIGRIHFHTKLAGPLVATAASLAFFVSLAQSRLWVAGAVTVLTYLMLLVLWERRELRGLLARP